MSKFQRVSDPADPKRCQGVGVHGQCPFRAVEGSTFCPRHGASVQLAAAAKQERRLYQLAKWQTQLESHAAAPNIKSLRDEIGLMRMMIQERVNFAKDPADLMLMSGAISNMLTGVGKLVQSCHRIEKELGLMLDKTQAGALVQEIVTIITKYVEDADILAFISEDLASTVEKLFNANAS